MTPCFPFGHLGCGVLRSLRGDGLVHAYPMRCVQAGSAGVALWLSPVDWDRDTTHGVYCVNPARGVVGFKSGRAWCGGKQRGREAQHLISPVRARLRDVTTQRHDVVTRDARDDTQDAAVGPGVTAGVPCRRRALRPGARLTLTRDVT